jgi:hypothetical protein
MGYSRIGEQRQKMSISLQDARRRNSVGKHVDQTQYLTTQADTGTDLDNSRLNVTGFDDSFASGGSPTRQGQETRKDPKRSNFISNPEVSPVNQMTFQPAPNLKDNPLLKMESNSNLKRTCSIADTCEGQGRNARSGEGSDTNLGQMRPINVTTINDLPEALEMNRARSPTSDGRIFHNFGDTLHQDDGSPTGKKWSACGSGERMPQGSFVPHDDESNHSPDKHDNNNKSAMTMQSIRSEVSEITNINDGVSTESPSKSMYGRALTKKNWISKKTPMLERKGSMMRNEDGTKDLNQYKFIKELGRGAFGKVILAKNNDDGRNYAVKSQNMKKLKRKFLMLGNNSGAMLRKEIAIMKKIDHPNLLNLIEVIEDEGDQKMHLVMEFVEWGPMMGDHHLEMINVTGKF